MAERAWVRPTARVVVLDPEGRVLLLGSRLQKDPAAPHHSQARGGILQRGRDAFAGVDIDSRETFFVLRDVVHEVAPRGLTEFELLGDEPHRWWSPDEVAATSEAFAPRELARLLPELLAGPWTGPPRVVD